MDDSSIKFGVAWFPPERKTTATDRVTTSLGECWAAIAGGSAQKISDIYKLPSNVIWITNLDSQELFSIQKNRQPSFKNKNWLKTDLTRLARELGIDPSSSPTGETVTYLSAVISRIANFSKQHFGLYKLSEQALHLDIVKALQPPKSNCPESAYIAIKDIAGHFAVSSMNHTNTTARNEIATFRRNRLLHALDVMSTPVPAEEGWTLVKNKEKKSAEAFIDSLGTNSFMIKAAIHYTSHHARFVAGWSGLADTPREWFTDVEYNTLKEHCDFEVFAAFINNNECTVFSLPQILDISVDAPIEALGLSLTLGLTAEAICAAFMSPQKKHIREKQGTFSTAAAWYRAKDKVCCFKAAFNVANLGHPVSSFGNGLTRFSFPERGLKNLMGDCSKSFLLPEIHSIKRIILESKQ